ncbi:hypothetical protein [Caldichromatium japonicum]|uniref:hypothetical protein n=1 Tax=Caldichromatium japonicum TaxID=2699430 RepID=UPI0031B56455
MGNRGITRDPAGKPHQSLRIVTNREFLDPLMHIVEPLLEPQHILACRMKAKMTGFDDPGVYCPDRDLKHTRTLNREKGVIDIGRGTADRFTEQWKLTSSPA